MNAVQPNAQKNVEQNRVPLTLDPKVIDWPATHYLFVEKRGSIPANAPQAWNEFHTQIPAIAEHNTITGYMSLYKMDEGIYRAGVAVAAAPKQIPAGLSYEKFSGGKYRKLVLTGPYSQLPQATGEAIGIVRDSGVRLRNDFNIENYVNDPRTTPEDQLITEILFPVE